jgi:hypothetical protein
MDNQSCCCPSRAVVRVIMPPTADRPHEVELLLCGHHFRLSQGTLAAAGAAFHVMDGELAAELALLLARRPAAARSVGCRVTRPARHRRSGGPRSSGAVRRCRDRSGRAARR